MPTADLPDDVAAVLNELTQKLSMQQAMSKLVVSAAVGGDAYQLVDDQVRRSAIVSNPPLAAALWLYVDELDKSHKISQGIDDATGSFWHGIMHRREGDFSNSHHWFRKVGAHPAMQHIDCPGGYDGHALIDQVEAARMSGDEPDELIATQRGEWLALFAWCAIQA